ncbi:MAG: NAD-dependent DNA ligase LigA, partial [Puniceicoccales bacterium]|nr:NAD-dependent DNA ligase LigA [Puniceicoccales bacterium]
MVERLTLILEKTRRQFDLLKNDIMDAKFNSQDPVKIRRKFQRLRSDVALHDRLYYRENRPQISDFEYDCLKAELLRLEEIAINLGIKTRKDLIGNDLAGGFQKYSHLSPMQSLSNTYSREELIAFDSKIKSRIRGQRYTYVIEPKIDGIAINLIYENGRLIRALTRGDGVLGDDVTENILVIQSLPERLQHCPGKLEIRGEIFINEKAFEITNEIRRAHGLEEYANPRNLAAGTVKSLDPQDAQTRDLKIITYAIGYASGDNLNTQNDVLKQLFDWGFPTQEKYWVALDMGEAWECIGELDMERKNFAYWTDGAVVKVNELNLHEILGNTAKAPRWAIAYKFAPMRVSTKLKNIILQVGRSGVVTPVADLEPIKVAGSTISRATLHNADEIAKKDIRINDYVFLEKAGEIIPSIVSIDLSKRTESCRPFVFPTHCPSCGYKLIKQTNEVAWRCTNPMCKAQLKSKIVYFASKSAMNIGDFGESAIEKLVDSGRLKTIADIYNLTYNDLITLPKFGQKSALNILSNIELSKNRPPWRLVNGLGILGIGEQIAKDLCEFFSSVAELSSARAEELASIGGVGEKIAQSIIDFFSNVDNQVMLENFKKHGLCLSSKYVITQHVAKL